MGYASHEKTAFTTPFRLFEFEVMPFGLHNSPATFQRLMNHILRDCQTFAWAYHNNIAVFSQSWEEHVRHLHEVFWCLAAARLVFGLKLESASLVVQGTLPWPHHWTGQYWAREEDHSSEGLPYPSYQERCACILVSYITMMWSLSH